MTSIQGLSVQLANGVVTVRAHRREQSGGGVIISSLVRRVHLPEHVDAGGVTSRLTCAGQRVFETSPAVPTPAVGSAGEKQKAVTSEPDAGSAVAEGSAPAADRQSEISGEATPTAQGEAVVEGPSTNATENCAADVVQKEEMYRVSMNVSNFQPEMSVKLESGVVMAQAARDETSGDGGPTYRLMRQFVLPHRVDPDRATSLLTRAGQVVIGAPVAAITAPALNQTGAPEIKVGPPETKTGAPEVRVGAPETGEETLEAEQEVKQPSFEPTKRTEPADTAVEAQAVHIAVQCEK
ncbi:uncharacterized protein LOC119101740 [Pollicipes pollicipes]|uniref:uncharacterized protein LOC119101740 n=1 Tax=Pollicipes pollicipes TaxID=41117 RepID=UPI001885042A|nr:uncharacterized protein LOC119101740 [Pollicipes pollicipes]